MLLQQARSLAARAPVTSGPLAPLAPSSALSSHALFFRVHSTDAAATSEDSHMHSLEWARAKPFQEIPGPKPYPLVGNLPRFMFKGDYGKLDLYEMQVKLQKNYGDIVRLSNVFRKKDIVFVFDPKMVETVFRHDGKWPIREGIKSLHYYRTVVRKDKFGDNIGTATSQGKIWHDFRTKVNQPLIHPSSARRYTAPINEVSEDFIARMRDLRDGNKELPADFINELYKWSLESIAVVALDKRLGCLEPNLPRDSEPQRIIEAVQVMFEAFYHLDMRPSLWHVVSTPLWRRFVKAMDYFYEVADKYINEAIERSKSKQGGEPSILERLMEVDPQVANVMASDMLSAGVDTTSHTSAAVLFFLAKHPEKQRKLGEEIRQVLPRVDSPITDDALNDMPYLKACFKEALRIFPIAIGNSRELQADLVLGDYQVPKGVDVLMCNMVMSRDERNYPRPLSFEPERWLRGTEEAHGAHPFTTLPFGFGPRTCIGRRFAELEVFTLVAKVIRNFWVEYHYGEAIKFEAKTINTITSPLKFRLIEHQN